MQEIHPRAQLANNPGSKNALHPKLYCSLLHRDEDDATILKQLLW